MKNQVNSARARQHYTPETSVVVQKNQSNQLVQKDNKVLLGMVGFWSITIALVVALGNLYVYVEKHQGGGWGVLAVLALIAVLFVPYRAVSQYFCNVSEGKTL